MSKTESSKYTHRVLGRFVIEAVTPLAVGSGEKDIMTDALVAVDANGLPYIPGTTLAGVMRSAMKINKDDDVWGYQKKAGGKGSEIIFTEAKILNSQGEVIDGMLTLHEKKDPLLLEYKSLPIRQHVRIGHKGTTEDAGKFDEQVVYAGTRFCFEVEILSDKDDKDYMIKMLAHLRRQSFRIGGGTRSGFGMISLVSAKLVTLDLSKQLEDYLEKSSNLMDSAAWWVNRDETDKQTDTADTTRYTLKLKARDFMLFGSGFGDERGDADMTTVKASKIDWATGTGELKKNLVLIPATSVKGAIRHRMIYHMNRLEGNWATDSASIEKFKENETVNSLFGHINGKDTTPGHVHISDVIEDEVPSKLLNHVSIDRFTGGAIDGALFTEQVDDVREREFTLLIDITDYELKGNAKKAFESTLNDICTGMLPLGGGVNRGNGVFTGFYEPKE
ncbi:MAG: RAMP superfamily CRISPR-associated protein [Bacteroidaceae bacterium]|nr:RAMP superfamily CRISPR-associated protein [Bacteroidaceae bacterium]